MIDDVKQFRLHLQGIALAFVGSLVTVNDYKDWSKMQDWYKSEYFKTKLENILIYDQAKITKEEYEMTRLKVHDFILNFVGAAKQLSESMKLFLEFTAKAADIQTLDSLLHSVSQLADDEASRVMHSFVIT